MLVNVFEKPVMKYVPFKAFFQQTGPTNASDRLGVYLEVPGGLEYFFDYKMTKKDGELNILTSDQTFNEAVSGIKEDKRKSKNFKYQTISQRIFLTRFFDLFAQ